MSTQIPAAAAAAAGPDHVTQLDAARARLLPPVEDALRLALQRRPDAPAHYGMMRYHLGWADERLAPADAPTGKRLRPLICLLAAEACGAAGDVAQPAAVALELLHNFTLIHDDIEDGDALRHHRPTVWKLWGEPQGINAGDGMHVLAYLALLDLVERGVPAATVVSLARKLGDASLIITEGQHLDLANEHRANVTPEEYLDMIGRKSAALISCSAAMGAEIAGAPQSVQESLSAFGFELGMGFQIRDDVLGIWGESETTGKPAGDLRRRKKTLPTLHALSRAGDEDRALLQRLFSDAQPSDDAVAGSLDVLERHDARGHCERMVARYSEQAHGHLQVLPASPTRDALEGLVDQLETREF